MGTHPIFESDFDCLTDLIRSKTLKMSLHLQWAIINKNSAFDLKRAGITWTKEPGHLKGKKSLKYNTLVNANGLKVAANAEGGVFQCRQTKCRLEKECTKNIQIYQKHR